MMSLNDALISHYHCFEIPLSELKQLVMLDETYLKEKKTWYIINETLKYFKKRKDLHLFTEQFFSIFGREIMGLNTVNYEIAYVCVEDIDLKTKSQKLLGLLSNNFQSQKNNYFLVSELFNPTLSDLVCYGGYSLETLLRFFKDFLCFEDYEKIKQFLINLFIADAFMMQFDRNYNNIGFEIEKVEDISYTKRLRPDELAQSTQNENIVKNIGGFNKLVGLKSSEVFDSEKIFVIDHKNGLKYSPGDVWCTAFPFKEGLQFRLEEKEKARAFVIQDYDGFDPNLFELIAAFPKEAREKIDRLAKDDEYRGILENFTNRKGQIFINPDVATYIEILLENRRKDFQKILSLY